MSRELKIINSLAISALAVMVLIAFLTIMADLQSSFKDWLGDIFWHHWVGKSILSVTLFIFLFVSFLMMPSFAAIERVEKNLWLLFWIGTAAAISIFTFYIYEAFFL